jgi:dihydrofolate reductase
MGKLVVSEFVTLDGVFEDPGGAEAVGYGGWAFKFDRGAEGDEFKLDELRAADALLLGRVTYEGFARAWPEREGTGEFAEKMNGMPKYVVSSRSELPEWNNTSVIDPGELDDRVAELKDTLAGDLLVAGSGRLVSALTERGLVDEYRLMVFPTVIGRGKRLFEGVGVPTPFSLADTRPAGETLILTYVPAGDHVG